MKHEPEFQKPPAPRQPVEDPRELANAYARLFSTPDGKRVLADLNTKFPINRAIFDRRSERLDLHRGLLRDGERAVMIEIHEAVAKGLPKSQPLNP